MRLHVPILALLCVCACYDAHTVLLNEVDGAVGTARPAPPAGCFEDDQNPPDRLECTGLYLDFANKQIAPDVRQFAPALTFWSDGAEKTRWIMLPPGAVIDISVPNEWSFPVGTKAWKEFKRGGQRIETRLFQKVRADKWLWAAYAWRDGETRTERSFGETVPVGDESHTIPLDTECDECHKGRTEKLLGFEGTLLGLDGAQGVSVATLAAEGRLSPMPTRAMQTIPDDGTGAAAPALLWLHANCGVSCHNENPRALAYPTGMSLRIDPAELAGKPLSEWNVVRTTLNAPAQVANFVGATRIVPGSPEQSLIVRLASTRGTKEQMPPIATRVVDTEGLSRVQEWIRRLAHNPQGMTAADASSMAQPPGALDAGTPLVIDGAAPDGEAREASDVPDSASPDASPVGS